MQDIIKFSPLIIFILAVAIRHLAQIILTRNIKQKGAKSSIPETLGLAACYSIAFFSAAAALFRNNNLTFLFLAGFAIMQISVALRMIALIKLGQYFSYEIRIAPDHKLITGGIYSIIRHPLHLAFFGEVLGMAVIAMTPVSLTAAAILAIIILHRNKIEDRILRNTFGKEFDHYAQNVPSLNIIRGIRRKLQEKKSSPGEQNEERTDN